MNYTAVCANIRFLATNSFLFDSHRMTPKHQEGLGIRSKHLILQMLQTFLRSTDFVEKITSAFLSTDIPFCKLIKNLFYDIGYTLPYKTTCRRIVLQLSEVSGNTSCNDFFPEITRPTSSLSRYRILPSINATNLTSAGDAWFDDITDDIDGRTSEMELLTEQAQQMILDSSIRNPLKQPSPPSSAHKRKFAKVNVGTESKRPKIYQTRSIFSSSRRVITKEVAKPKVPKEPSLGEVRILIALKLPDGTRVERYFSPHTRLIEVLAYAHSQYPVLPLAQCNLFRMDVVPKKLLNNTNLSLEDVGVKNRTVLYVEEKDDED